MTKKSHTRFKELLMLYPTYRIELLNAFSMLTWSGFLARGILRGDGFEAFPNLAQMLAIMPLTWWVVLLGDIGCLQIWGVVYGRKGARVIAAFLASVVLFSLVWVFGLKDIRFPFVSYGFFTACGQWIALIYLMTADTVTPLVVRNVSPDSRATVLK